MNDNPTSQTEPAPKSAPAPLTLNSYWIAFISYLLLLFFIPFSLIWNHDSTLPTLGISLFVWIAPMLLPLPGYFRKNPYTFAWANFLVVMYLCRASANLYLYFESWPFHLVELLLACSAFIAGTYYARWRGMELGLELKKSQ